VALYRETPWERIERIKRGLPVSWLALTALEIGIPEAKLAAILGIKRQGRSDAGVRRLLENGASERLLGLMRLIGQVQVMLAESGDCSDFNAALWLGNWLRCPLAALNGTLPAELLDTVEGTNLLSELLARMQSGGVA
jgi:uncharacterized protein (DUF2384 family)